jgi:hypothetical protein
MRLTCGNHAVRCPGCLEKVCTVVLQHQGTVHPATAAAAPFLCQIVLDPASLWRASLAADLALLSTGYDELVASAGTARAVRDATHPYADELLGLWEPGIQDLT